MRSQTTQNAATEADLVLTLTVAGQPCGVPVLAVRDVLGTQSITPIPLAPAEIAGAMNLRGRIVTAVDLRRRLGLPRRAEGAEPMSVVVEQGGELYAMLADAVGEVVPLTALDRAPNPPTLDPVWRDVSRGVHRRDGQLLILLDVERLLAIGGCAVNCLVVDDSRVVRKAARRLLEGFGFAVREAADGAEALTACREALPDFVLLDWNMPVMDGLEFLRVSRAEHGAGRPLVMLCTTENTQQKILQALEAGAQEYVMKPFNAEILGGKLVQLGLLRDAA